MMCWLLVILGLVIIIGLSLSLYQKTTNAICLSRRRLDGRTVIVTGGTAGMGLIIATDLAHRGARVIIACPFDDEGYNARKQIIKQTGNENVVFKKLDLVSWESTRQFAKDILKNEDRLDILINNAGTGQPHNAVMRVNYYGTFLLTMLLLPLLKKTGKPGEASRIIMTTSVLHMIGKIDINKFNKSSFWNVLLVYGNSKICLISFANELTRCLKGSNVVVNNVDPGAVGTRIFNSLTWIVGIILTITFTLFFKTPWEGAQTALHVALDKEAGEVSGAYFKNCKISKAVKRAYNEKVDKELWEHSVKTVELGDLELENCFKTL